MQSIPHVTLSYQISQSIDNLESMVSMYATKSVPYYLYDPIE